MENSSKALLIAAAVLIVIILIAFGVKVFSSPKDVAQQSEGVGASITHITTDATEDLAATFATQRTFISGETTYYPIDEVNSSSDIQEWYGNDGKEKPTYTYTNNEWNIDSVEKLKFFADFVNGTNLTEEERLGYEINENTKVCLTNNLNLNNKLWTPIGKDLEHKFVGTFEGNNNKITCLNVNQQSDYAGLFGYASVIKNLSIENSNVQTTTNYSGAIAGYITKEVNNCSNTGTKISGNCYVGGIIGCAKNESEINNCTNNGEVSGKEHIAGIIGSATKKLKVENCTNTGNISGTNRIGGISGDVTFYVTINNCKNSGNITLIYTSNGQYAGGITGLICTTSTGDHSSEGKSEITSCTNTGTIEGRASIGGIAGCVAKYGSVIKNCTNSGKIKGINNSPEMKEGISIAGISGTLGRSSTIENCTNNGNISGTSNVAGITGATYSSAADKNESNQIIKTYSEPCEIKGCINNGTLKNEISPKDICIGQIIASNGNTSKTENCKENGNITN